MPIFVKPSLFKSRRLNGLSKRPVSRYENNYGGALLLRAGISLVRSTDHHLLLCPFTLLKMGELLKSLGLVESGDQLIVKDMLTAE